jgi:hypothetical protein
LAKAIKIRGKYLLVVKLILFNALIVLFFNQVFRLPGKIQPLFIDRELPFLMCLFFIPVNWWLEWKKWTVTLNEAKFELPIKRQRDAFGAGMITGFFTPSMLGNFIGRLAFFTPSQQLKVSYLTQYSNLAQFTVTICVGFLAIACTSGSTLPSPFAGNWGALGSVFSFICLLIYVGSDFLVRKVKWLKLRIAFLQEEPVSFRYRLKLLGLSAIRHFVFTIQFSLLLAAFGVDFNWENILVIWQIYLWVTIVPSLFFGKIVIRDSIAWWILAPLGFSAHTVLSTTLWIWILNLLLPAIFFLVLVKFRRQ